jgi:hypothetical protein
MRHALADPRQPIFRLQKNLEPQLRLLDQSHCLLEFKNNEAQSERRGQILVEFARGASGGNTPKVS